ncbi:MAG: 3-dehydroquinate synthase [Fimbriimonadales bacterium]|nr:MAG: 3-dehydroquinate synthase [Fimbriimonadales bacterium]
MNKVAFPCPAGEYPVWVGTDCRAAVAKAVEELAPSAVYLVADRTAWEYHGTEYAGLGEAFLFEPGEGSKTISVWSSILEWLAERRADRKSLLIAFGGGVAADLGGFVAATYMRGISHLNVATTLLAQVDAALGGKTGLDLPQGKNLVGAFHHPIGVACDPRFVLTLPERQMRNGMAEVVKYACVFDPSLFEELQSGEGAALASGVAFFESVCLRCIEHKAAVVREDPEDRLGKRALLNFGHTVGHAIEAALGYSGIYHGEAVAIGMVVETWVGERMGMTESGLTERLRELLLEWRLPVGLDGRCRIEDVVERLFLDKKAEGGRIALVIPARVGQAEIVSGVSAELIEEGLRAL